MKKRSRKILSGVLILFIILMAWPPLIIQAGREEDLKNAWTHNEGEAWIFVEKFVAYCSIEYFDGNQPSDYRLPTLTSEEAGTTYALTKVSGADLSLDPATGQISAPLTGVGVYTVSAAGHQYTLIVVPKIDFELTQRGEPVQEISGRMGEEIEEPYYLTVSLQGSRFKDVDSLPQSEFKIWLPDNTGFNLEIEKIGEADGGTQLKLKIAGTPKFPLEYALGIEIPRTNLDNISQGNHEAFYKVRKLSEDLLIKIKKGFFPEVPEIGGSRCFV